METQLPESADLIEIDEEQLYTNLDHTFRPDIAKILQDRPNETYGHHAAWDFCGYVWFDGTKWKEEIWIYGVPRDLLEADTVEDLIKQANSEYGSE